MTTKLRAPDLPARRLSRPRLVASIEESLAFGVVLVSAPAGYGKTMAVAEWARSAGDPVGWLSVDPGDGDPIRFWRHLIAAVDSALPGTADRVGPMASEGELAITSVVTALIDTVADAGRRVVVVIDDYDAVDSPAVDSTSGICCRSDPPT